MAQSPASANAARTTAEQVQRWAPAGANVVDVRSRGDSDLDFGRGVDVFMVTLPDHPPADDGRGQFSVVAIVGGVGHPILEDKAAILGAVARTTNDAQKLARLGLLLNGRDESPLKGAANDEQRKAGVRPSSNVSNAVEFWILSGTPGRNLYKCRLDLSTAALTIDAAPKASDGAIDAAVAALQSGNPAALQQGLDALAAACPCDPAAKRLLFETLANHAREEVRAAAAFSAPRCGHDALAPLLSSLEHDKSRLVRGKAAIALGELGDKGAIPTLERAVTTDISTAASIALEKLRKK